MAPNSVIINYYLAGLIKFKNYSSMYGSSLTHQYIQIQNTR